MSSRLATASSTTFQYTLSHRQRRRPVRARVWTGTLLATLMSRQVRSACLDALRTNIDSRLIRPSADTATTKRLLAVWELMIQSLIVVRCSTGLAKIDGHDFLLHRDMVNFAVVVFDDG